MTVLASEERARDVVVVGASAGGVVALTKMLGALREYYGTIMVVLHRSPFVASDLADVLSGFSPGRARMREAIDDEVILPSRIYIAPRDHHLTVREGRFELSRGPKEHHTRPAIDALFRSAAAFYRKRLIGVLLTGGGEDGTSGLIDVKQYGGISIVQDPGEAEHPWMPLNAINKDHVDMMLPLAGIAAMLHQLAREPLAGDEAVVAANAVARPRLLRRRGTSTA